MMHPNQIILLQCTCIAVSQSQKLKIDIISSRLMRSVKCANVLSVLWDKTWEHDCHHNKLFVVPIFTKLLFRIDRVKVELVFVIAIDTLSLLSLTLLVCFLWTRNDIEKKWLRRLNYWSQKAKNTKVERQKAIIDCTKKLGPEKIDRIEIHF